MYEDIEVNAEEEARLLEQAAQKIHDFGMETVAIIFLESCKPLIWIGGEMGRFFITPFAPILGDGWDVKSEKFFVVFEKRENIEKLLKRIEELADESENKKENKTDVRKAEKEVGEQTVSESDKSHPKEKSENERKGWRYYFH